MRSGTLSPRSPQPRPSGIDDWEHATEPDPVRLELQAIGLSDHEGRTMTRRAIAGAVLFLGVVSGCEGAGDSGDTLETLTSAGTGEDASSSGSDGSGSSSSGSGGNSNSSGSSGTPDGTADDSSTGLGYIILELPASADATVDNLNDGKVDNTDVNFGFEEHLEVEGPVGGEREQRSYLRFEIDDIEGTVIEATLRLTVRELGGAGGDIYAVPELDAMGMQWTEGEITWNNAVPVPTDDPPLDSVINEPTSTVEFDVTEAIAWGSTQSFAIVALEFDDEVEYWSREADEAASHPRLFVTVDPP
jgi:hypothetical protein